MNCVLEFNSTVHANAAAMMQPCLRQGQVGQLTYAHTIDVISSRADQCIYATVRDVLPNHWLYRLLSKPEQKQEIK